MAAVQTRKNKVGNFLKKEFWPEEHYCREVVTVTYAGLNKVAPGEIVWLGTTGSAYAAVPASISTAHSVGIIVDEYFDDKVAADLELGSPVGSVSTTILKRGPAVVRKGGLSVANATDIADVYTVLENNDILLVDFVSTYSQS